MSKNAIFVTWDGPQTFYLENLFFPLFRKLGQFGWSFDVVQFTWAGPEVSKARQSAAADAGVGFRAVEIGPGRGILASVHTVMRSVATLRKVAAAKPSSVMIFRSIVPAVIVRISRISKTVVLIYDSDGLPIEEKIEDGTLRPKSLTTRLLSSCEAWALKNSAVILARTQFGARELANKVPGLSAEHKVRVVSNGRVENRRVLGHVWPSDDHNAERSLKLAYLGSWGDRYRPRAMLEIAVRIKTRFPQTEFGIFTGDLERAELDLRRQNLATEDWISLARLSPGDVEESLVSCDIGFSLRTQSRSAQAVSPVKLGEYLDAGLAIIGDLVGERAYALAQDHLLFVQDTSSDQSLFEWIEETVLADKSMRRDQARAAAINLFGIERSVQGYERALSFAMREPRDYLSESRA